MAYSGYALLHCRHLSYSTARHWVRTCRGDFATVCDKLSRAWATDRFIQGDDGSIFVEQLGPEDEDGLVEVSYVPGASPVEEGDTFHQGDH